MTVISAFLHHIFFAALLITRSVVMGILRQPLTVESARRLLIVDRIYLIALGALFTVGLLRVFFFEKGPAYYWSTDAFLAKFGLFIVVAVLAIFPTFEFLKWRKNLDEGKIPEVAPGVIEKLRTILHWELVAIALIFFFAAWMAKGSFY